MDKIRINKYLAENGICSRRKADEHILSGRVYINGKKAILGDIVNPEIDDVKVDGLVLDYKPIDHEYWAVYKPVGYVSTAKDEHNRKIVTDLVNSCTRLYPVGRLDKDSEGLIILTNDGELTKLLSHPSYEHLKRYIVLARQTTPHPKAYYKSGFEKGLRIDQKIMKAEKVISIANDSAKGVLRIELDMITGYNRQIRKMCAKMDLDVLKLIRTGISKLNLYDLKLIAGKALKINKKDIV